MVKITAEYLGDLRNNALHLPSGSELVTDAPVDNHGKGEFFSPTDLCATALMTCVSTIMGIQAESMGLDLSGMKMSIEKHMTTKPPRRIDALDLVLDMPVELDEKQKKKMERAAHSCPVHQSLHPDIKISIQFNWK